MTTRKNQAIALAAPITIWAVHFIALYGLISASCGPRMLMPIAVMQMTTFIVTVVALIGAGLPLIRVPVRHQGDDLATAIRVCALISVIAIIANALSFPFFSSCGG
ncbi:MULTISPECIES: hypothetical protein [unclassified Roseitalea]|uniref:hypothetical protein n=1 Tax=unclassified Roseitalea TaxID=2639107 RepID=UPI00273E1BA8|nr:MULTISPECIES: hypothetical protein [unclassified Roseitalea]